MHILNARGPLNRGALGHGLVGLCLNPPTQPLVGWVGGYPLHTPYPLGAYGAWTLAPSALVTRRALILAPSVLAYRRPPTVFFDKSNTDCGVAPAMA